MDDSFVTTRPTRRRVQTQVNTRRSHGGSVSTSSGVSAKSKQVRKSTGSSLPHYAQPTRASVARAHLDGVPVIAEEEPCGPTDEHADVSASTLDTQPAASNRSRPTNTRSKSKAADQSSAISAPAPARSRVAVTLKPTLQHAATKQEDLSDRVLEPLTLNAPGSMCGSSLGQQQPTNSQQIQQPLVPQELTPTSQQPSAQGAMLAPGPFSSTGDAYLTQVSHAPSRIPQAPGSSPARVSNSRSSTSTHTNPCYPAPSSAASAAASADDLDFQQEVHAPTAAASAIAASDIFRADQAGYLSPFPQANQQHITFSFSVKDSAPSPLSPAPVTPSYHPNSGSTAAVADAATAAADLNGTVTLLATPPVVNGGPQLVPYSATPGTRAAGQGSHTPPTTAAGTTSVPRIPAFGSPLSTSQSPAEVLTSTPGRRPSPSVASQQHQQQYSPGAAASRLSLSSSSRVTPASPAAAAAGRTPACAAGPGGGAISPGRGLRGCSSSSRSTPALAAKLQDLEEAWVKMSPGPGGSSSRASTPRRAAAVAAAMGELCSSPGAVLTPRSPCLTGAIATAGACSSPATATAAALNPAAAAASSPGGKAALAAKLQDLEDTWAKMSPKAAGGCNSRSSTPRRAAEPAAAAEVDGGFCGAITPGAAGAMTQGSKALNGTNSKQQQKGDDQRISDSGDLGLGAENSGDRLVREVPGTPISFFGHIQMTPKTGLGKAMRVPLEGGGGLLFGSGGEGAQPAAPATAPVKSSAAGRWPRSAANAGYAVSAASSRITPRRRSVGASNRNSSSSWEGKKAVVAGVQPMAKTARGSIIGSVRSSAPAAVAAALDVEDEEGGEFGVGAVKPGNKRGRAAGAVGSDQGQGVGMNSTTTSSVTRGVTTRSRVKAVAHNPLPLPPAACAGAGAGGGGGARRSPRGVVASPAYRSARSAPGAAAAAGGGAGAGAAPEGSLSPELGAFTFSSGTPAKAVRQQGGRGKQGPRGTGATAATAAPPAAEVLRSAAKRRNSSNAVPSAAAVKDGGEVGASADGDMEGMGSGLQKSSSKGGGDLASAGTIAASPIAAAAGQEQTPARVLPPLSPPPSSSSTGYGRLKSPSLSPYLVAGNSGCEGGSVTGTRKTARQQQQEMPLLTTADGEALSPEFPAAHCSSVGAAAVELNPATPAAAAGAGGAVAVVEQAGFGECRWLAPSPDQLGSTDDDSWPDEGHHKEQLVQKGVGNDASSMGDGEGTGVAGKQHVDECKGLGLYEPSQQQQQLDAEGQPGTPPSATTKRGPMDPLADDMSQLNLDSPVPSEVFYTPMGWGSSPGGAGQSPGGRYSSSRGQRQVGAAAATPGGGGVELFYTPAPAAASMGMSPGKGGGAGAAGEINPTPLTAPSAAATGAGGGGGTVVGVVPGSAGGSLSCQLSAAGGGQQQQVVLDGITAAAGGVGGGGDQQVMLPAMQFTLVLPAMQVMLPTTAAGTGGGAAVAGAGGQVTPQVILAAAAAQGTPVSGAWSGGPKALGALFEEAKGGATGGKMVPGSAASAAAGGGGGGGVGRTPDSGGFGGFKMGANRERGSGGVVRGRARVGAAGQLVRDAGGVDSLDQGGRRAEEAGSGIKAAGGGGASAGKWSDSFPSKWQAGGGGELRDAEGKDQGGEEGTEGPAGEQSHNQRQRQQQRRRWSAPGSGYKSNSNRTAEVKGQEKHAALLPVQEASGASAAVSERMSAVARRNAAAVAQHMMRTRRQSAGAALAQLSWDPTA